MKFAVALLIGVISATKVENFSELAPHSYIESPNNLVQQAAESESESSDSEEEDIPATPSVSFFGGITSLPQPPTSTYSPERNSRRSGSFRSPSLSTGARNSSPGIYVSPVKEESKGVCQACIVS